MADYVLQRRRGQAAVLRGVVQAGRGGQTVPVHGAQAARSLDVRAEVFVFVRDRARGERPAPPRIVVVRHRQRQTDVPVAVPERQQHVEVGLHKSAERVRVRRPVAEEKAKKTGPEERRRRWRRQQRRKQRRRRRRQKQIAATIVTSGRRVDRETNTGPGPRAVFEHGVFRESYFI